VKTEINNTNTGKNLQKKLGFHGCDSGPLGLTAFDNSADINKDIPIKNTLFSGIESSSPNGNKFSKA
jgi:hypothetical protein